MRPEMEKKKFELRHIVYIIIIIVCLVAVGVAVYMQFFKDEKLGVIVGITKEKEDEEIKKLKENFLNIFDNNIEKVSEYNGSVNKIKEDEDIILVAYDTQEQEENYMVDFKIPYFNINSDVAKQYNQQIKSIFKDKSENKHHNRCHYQTYRHAHCHIVSIADGIAAGCGVVTHSHKREHVGDRCHACRDG